MSQPAHPVLRSCTAAAVALLVAVAGPAVATAPAAAAPVAPDDAVAAKRPMAVMAAATSVASRSDRRPVAGGVYDAVARKTFITWGGAGQDNYAQAYDHRTGTWSAPVLAATGGGDSHNYPTLIQADDGHLLVIRGVHNRELMMARSAGPHSIEGTWTETRIVEGDGATYPMPFKTANGDIYIFVRETVRDIDPTAPPDFRPIKFARSTDNGRTWQSSEQLTGDKYNIAPQGRTDNMNEIYIGQMRYERTLLGGERIHVVYTLAGGGPEGPLHDRYHRNIYYTWFSPKTLHFHSASGRDMGTRIDDAEQERYLRIVETPLQQPPAPPRSPDYISLVGSWVPGLPFVLWMQHDAAGVVHTHYGTWTGRSWRTSEVAQGVRVRDMEQVGLLTWQVYATPEPLGATGIATFRLRPGSGLQSAGPILATPKAVQRIEVIGDYRDPARLLASGASSARDVAVADGDVYVVGFPRR
jgi:hypothetical protein